MIEKKSYAFVQGFKFKKENLVKYKDIKEDLDLFFLLESSINHPTRKFSVYPLSEQYLLLGTALSFISKNQKVKPEALTFTLPISEKTLITKAWIDASIVKDPHKFELSTYFI
jgi:hypothetical protein